MSQIAFRNVTLILLAFTSGCVDAVGYLGLGHVFTANMTGNIVLLGLAIGHSQGLTVMHSLTALIGFIIGAITASEMVRRQKEHAFLPIHLRMALSLECFILIAFAIGSQFAAPTATGTLDNTLILLLGMAMGIQSNTAMRLGVKGITTTVMTSTLAAVIEELADILRRSDKSDERDPGDTMVRGATLISYGVGAVLGGVALPNRLSTAIWIPIGILVCIVLVSLIRFKTPSESQRVFKS